MPAPKSVVKIKKDGIEYTTNVDAAQFYIHELNRAALRDVGKFLRVTFRERFYARFKRRTGKAGKVTKCEILAKKSTKYPRLNIGLSTGKVDGFYAYFQEVGTSKTPRLAILQNAVKDNVDKIVQIESQYLSGLSGEAEALNSMINESDIVEDD